MLNTNTNFFVNIYKHYINNNYYLIQNGDINQNQNNKAKTTNKATAEMERMLAESGFLGHFLQDLI